MDRRVRIIVLSNLLLLTVVAAGMGVYMISAYKSLDDFWYCSPMRQWFIDHNAKLAECGWDALCEGFPMDLIKEVWCGHLNFDNGRLGNILVVFFLLLPKWFGSSLAFCFWLLCMYNGFRLAKVSIRHSYIVAVGIFLWSFQMPWEDWMGGLDYQFNYIIPSGLMMWFLSWVIFGNFNKCISALMILSGLIVGAWHEGFTLPVVIGGVAVLWIYPELRTRRYCLALVSLTVGLLYLTLCPGTLVRLCWSTKMIMHSWLLMAQLFFSHVAYLIFLIWGIRKIKRNGISGVHPLIWFGLISATLSISMQILSNGVPRGGWWADLISIICIMNMLNGVSAHAWCRRRCVKISMYIASASLSVAHWVAVDYYALEARHLFEQVFTAYEVRKQRVVFVKERTVMDLPLICLWTPNLRVFKDEWSMGSMRSFYCDYDANLFLSVIPDKLRDITAESGEAVSGNSGIRREEGFLFSPYKKEWWPRIKSEMQMSTGLGGEQWFLTFPFVSEKDGKKYLYIYPIDRNWKILFGKMESIEVEID